MVVGKNKSATTKMQGGRIAGDFDCHVDAAVQSGAHRPMEHIPVFNRSHWMLPSVECSHRIAAAAAMVNDFG